MIRLTRPNACSAVENTSNLLMVVYLYTIVPCLHVCFFLNLLCLLYPPSERSEVARYHVILFSFRPSVRLCALMYLDANISKMV